MKTIDQVLLSDNRANLSAERRLQLIAEAVASGIAPGMEAEALKTLASVAAGTATGNEIETIARHIGLWDKWEAEDKAAKAASDMARSDKLDAEGYVPVRIAYKDKDKFKRKFPSARWDNVRRSWMVPASDEEAARVWES